MPRTPQFAQDPSLLNATLEGLEAQKQRIEEQIRQVRAMLGGAKRGRPAAGASTSTSERPRKTRKLSAEARKRIAAAQKRRWAEFRKTNAQS